MGIMTKWEHPITGELRFTNVSSSNNESNINLLPYFGLSHHDAVLHAVFNDFFKLEVYKRKNQWTEDVVKNEQCFVLEFDNSHHLRDLLIEEPYEGVMEFRNSLCRPRLIKVISNIFTAYGCKILDLTPENLDENLYIRFLSNYQMSVVGKILDHKKFL